MRSEAMGNVKGRYLDCNEVEARVGASGVLQEARHGSLGEA